MIASPKRKTFLLLLTLLLALAPESSFGRESFVWWEAENAASTNLSTRHAFAPENPEQAKKLSGGAWLGSSSDQRPLSFAEYQLDIPAAGTYRLYARRFWKHGPFRYRFEGGPWNLASRDIALIDVATLRRHVEANWIALGSVDLPAGATKFRIELTEPAGPAALDCFLLVKGDFTPNGTQRPGQKLGTTTPGFFPFEPDPDTDEPSPIDLRHLNESFAGQHGRIVAQGQTLIHASTQEPLRFWAVNTGIDTLGMDDDQLAMMARFLARRGVNMIRLHGLLGDPKNGRVERIERVHAFVQAMKAQGIYTTLSIYFPLWIKLKPEDGYGSYNDAHPFGLLYFDEKFQAVYLSWWQELLTKPDPRTGIALKDEPAVAMCELVNEDSLFFWTFAPYDRIPAEPMNKLETMFGAWLANRYGSIEKAMSRWPKHDVRGDAPAEGRVGFAGAWAMFDRPDSRSQDQVRFLFDIQTRFHEKAIQHIKSIGYPGLIVASNWKTANDRVLGPIDKLSNAVADVMDRHAYFDGRHRGPMAGWSIQVGDAFADRSMLRFDNSNPENADREITSPLFDITWQDKPSIVSEIGWLPPNRYRTEFPMLAAAYASLQGQDGVYFFAHGRSGWDTTITKFSIATPAVMGQFPAAALAYRRGLIAEAPAVARLGLATDRLFALKGAPAFQRPNLDAIRTADVPDPSQLPAPRSLNANELAGFTLDPLAHFVGRVELNIAENPETSRVIDITPFIDRNARRITSLTRQIVLDYDRGLLKVDAPHISSLVGFFADTGKLETSNLLLESTLPYGSVTLISLDDRPINDSKRMLLQVMSVDQNDGFKVGTGALKRIDALGTPPLVIQNLTGTVTLLRPDADQLNVKRLDLNGRPIPEIQSNDPPPSAARIELHPETLYYLIEPRN